MSGSCWDPEMGTPLVEVDWEPGGSSIGGLLGEGLMDIPGLGMTRGKAVEAGLGRREHLYFIKHPPPFYLTSSNFCVYQCLVFSNIFDSISAPLGRKVFLAISRTRGERTMWERVPEQGESPGGSSEALLPVSRKTLDRCLVLIQNGVE